MILNVPSAEDLNVVARRLYFSAWTQLIEIQSDLIGYINHVSEYSDDRSEIENETKSYLSRSQPDLQSLFVLVQQSNELALKARICEVSPYLLLLKNEGRLKTEPADTDFSEFRTLDATDLPGAVNSFSIKHLSAKYIQGYNLLRKQRNKISHLGHKLEEFKTDELFRMLALQWIEFWRDRLWLKDRADFECQKRNSLFHDYKYNSHMMVVFQELSLTLHSFTEKEFKNIFGCTRKSVSYLCHRCFYEGNTRNSGLEVTWSKSALISKDRTEVNCLICGKNHKIEVRECSNAECKFGVLSLDTDYKGKCHTCGEHNKS
jgi:hypothetical protein